jgi:hypothetical protein
MARTLVVSRAREVYYCTFNNTVTDSVASIAPTNNANTSYVTGYFSGTKALSLNTSTGNFSIPTPSNFMKEGTFACWLLQNNLPGASSWFLYSSKSSSGQDSNRVILGAGVGIKFECIDHENVTHVLTGSAAYFTAGVWVHVGITWKPGEMKLYINGTSQGTPPTNVILDAVNQPNLYIMCRNSGNQTDGAIANLIIYNRSISSSGMARMAARNTPIQLGEYFDY